MCGTPGGKYTAMLLLLGVLLLRPCGGVNMWLLCTLLLLLLWVQATCREVLLVRALPLQRSLLGPDMCCCHTKMPACCTTEDGCTCMLLHGGAEADTGIHAAAADCCKQPAQRTSSVLELDRY